MVDKDQVESIYELTIEDNKQLTEKQRNIIKAAVDIFARKGFAGSSTSEIAKQAGVAEGTIFRHYTTKKALLIAIVSPVMSRLVAPFLIQDLNKVLDHDYETFGDFLKALLLNRQVFLKKNLPILKIMLQEIPFQPELKEQFKQHVGRQVFNKLAVIVEHYQSKGQIINIPASSVIRMTASSVAGYLLSRFVLLPEVEWNEEIEMDRTIEFIMKGLTPQ
ncbi:TetR/AcrR family transcriptional regulator [Tuberibacillus sp. Marseille-P3662]|uniref:TetR/AcrR family transcriptional regulator n=1 Tax=Tuberibacillus sp. Marseille-P3662 TaxID=1965358 RepID=UPI000A1C935A|nr:TetR/AcrR family transcriptional regulator [Tuberibacillus sp. Marseille-P3662]